MGASKKKAKFIAKGHLQQKLKQRNAKKKFQALKSKKKNRFERNSDAPARKPRADAAAAASGSAKREDDMLDDMDVDDFLNAEFLESGDEEPESDADMAADGDDSDDEGAAFAGSFERKGGEDDGESSEEEDESALDPRYMAGLPKFDDDDEEEQPEEDDGDDDEEDAGDADAPMDKDDEGEAEAETEEPAVGRTIVTMALLAKAEKECFEGQSAGGLRRLMKIFSDSCRSSDAADVSKLGEIMYDIQSSAVYNRLMLNVFRKTHVTLAALVGSGDSAKVDERKWKKHALVVRRFFNCVCYLLEQTTGQDIQQFVLRELAAYVPFVTPCPKTARRLLKALLKLWAKSLNANVCMLAFVRIRDLALQMPFPFLETCLKGLLITYVRNTKFTNESTLPHHVLLGNCVVELYGLDMASSYQHAFIYIRQLAIAIRKTIVSPSAEAFQAVLNWQFVNQLRVWTAVVCAYPSAEQLQPLVYPLCQLLFAVARLANTLKFAPTRFHCVKLLQQIAFATNAFVPTSSVLLEMLALQPYSSSYKGHKTGGNKKKAPGGGARVELNLDMCVKLSKSALEDKRVHDQVFAKLVELLQRECDVYKFHIGFPEFAVPLQLSLSKFADSAAVPKWKSLTRGLLDSIKRRSEWIRTKRNGLDISPKEMDKIDAFLKSEREAAVEKLRQQDVKALQDLLDKSSGAEGSQDDVSRPYDSDASDDEGDDEDEQPKEEKKQPKKKGKKGKKARSGVEVDEETVSKVKQMSLKEFKKSVAAVDAADEVGDFAFSSDEE